MSNAQKPRIRVELRTPQGSVHRADESLSESLVDLFDRSSKSRDKNDMFRVAEGILDAGGRVVVQIATSVVRSLRGAPAT